jgi:hypothetical protein
MKTLIILTCFFAFNNFWEIISLLLAVFALILSIGFLIRPRLSCSIYYEDNKIKVKLFNDNKFRKIIEDIKCEMALSNDPSFSGIVDTLELEKEWIVCLLKSNNNNNNIERPNYVFKLKKPVDPINKTHLRIRFLIPNFLGIKKAYEIIVPVKEFVNQPIIRIPKKPK